MCKNVQIWNFHDLFSGSAIKRSCLEGLCLQSVFFFNWIQLAPVTLIYVFIYISCSS